LRSKAYDEPVDAMIYLMTAALGFAALENTLFVLKDLLENGSAIGMLTTSMRTVGATLLHVAASALIGGSLALVFYKSKVSRFFMLIVGIILATALHTLFNQLIIATKGEGTLYVFGGLWILIVGIILLFEYIKNRKQPSRII
jgi:RsiW-degrading membrane proteinase PrsW (M82 family)